MKTVVEIEPAYRELLHAAELSDFDAVMTAKGGPPASKHAQRETVPLTVNDPTTGRAVELFIKRVFWVPPKHAIWPLARLRRGSSQPAREWRTLAQLKAAGIPAMDRVAYGERRRMCIPREGFLIVKRVPMAHTVHDWLHSHVAAMPPVAEWVRRRLPYEVGRLLGRLHGAGFLWLDAQAKHIFATPSRSSGPYSHWKFRLIDVERMRSCGSSVGAERLPFVFSLDFQRMVSSLLPSLFSEYDLRRFAAGYRDAAGRGDATSHFNLVFMQVRDQIRRKPRLADAPSQGDVGATIEWPGMRVDPACEPWLSNAGLRSLGAVFEFPLEKRLDKPGLDRHRERARLTLTDPLGQRRVFFIKRYNRPPLSQQIRRAREAGADRTTAEHEARWARKLARLGIPAVRIAAYGGERKGWRELRSFSIAEGIDGISLETLVGRLERKEMAELPVRERHQIIRQLAWITSRMHQARLFHRDLYLCHVFLTRDSEGGIALRLIDLARMIERPWLPRRWVVKDLAALDFSSPPGIATRTDRFRFLREYDAQIWSCSKPGARKYHLWMRIREIAARRDRMARHDARRARRFGQSRADSSFARTDYARQP